MPDPTPTPGRQAAIEAAAKAWYERLRRANGYQDQGTWEQITALWRSEWRARTVPIIAAYERTLAAEQPPREKRVEWGDEDGIAEPMDYTPIGKPSRGEEERLLNAIYELRRRLSNGLPYTARPEREWQEATIAEVDAEFGDQLTALAARKEEVNE